MIFFVESSQVDTLRDVFMIFKLVLRKESKIVETNLKTKQTNDELWFQNLCCLIYSIGVLSKTVQLQTDKMLVTSTLFYWVFTELRLERLLNCLGL